MKNPLILPVQGILPLIGKNCFLAPNATIIGSVIIGDESSIWFNTVVRGDVNKITIGYRTNIQDGAIIHCTYEKTETKIGDNVSIGHNAIVHGCTIEDTVLIGMGAIVMDNAYIESNVMIAAGAVVLENTRCENGWLYAGVPAKKVKPLNEALSATIINTPDKYVNYSKWFIEKTKD